jgi:hypothetical protein
MIPRDRRFSAWYVYRLRHFDNAKTLVESVEDESWGHPKSRQGKSLHLFLTAYVPEGRFELPWTGVHAV